MSNQGDIEHIEIDLDSTISADGFFRRLAREDPDPDVRAELSAKLTGGFIVAFYNSEPTQKGALAPRVERTTYDLDEARQWATTYRPFEHVWTAIIYTDLDGKLQFPPVERR